MEISAVLGNLAQLIVDLIVNDLLLVGEVFDGDAASLAEGHLPIAVEGTAGIDADRQGNDRGIPVPSVAEEVTGRTFHGRHLAVLPVDAQNPVAESAGQGCPDLGDAAGPLNIRKGQDLAGANACAGIDLPAESQISGLTGGETLSDGTGAADSLGTGGVLAGNGACNGICHSGEIAHGICKEHKCHLNVTSYSVESMQSVISLYVNTLKNSRENDTGSKM